jgi:small subunit ribosomal protein S9
MELINAIGRRKSAIARIYLNDGTGQITVNDTDYKKYFSTQQLQYIIHQPLNLLSVKDKYDIKVNLEGGGISGQAEALRLAIARALIKITPESKHQLKVNGFLTRDSREVERKKPGQKKARKRFQFSKR